MTDRLLLEAAHEGVLLEAKYAQRDAGQASAIAQRDLMRARRLITAATHT